MPPLLQPAPRIFTCRFQVSAFQRFSVLLHVFCWREVISSGRRAKRGQPQFGASSLVTERTHGLTRPLFFLQTDAVLPIIRHAQSSGADIQGLSGEP